MACRGCSAGDGCSCSVVGSTDGVIGMAGTGTPVTSPYRPTFNDDVWLESLALDETACEDLFDPTVPVLLGNGSVVRVPLPCADSGATSGPQQIVNVELDEDDLYEPTLDQAEALFVVTSP